MKKKERKIKNIRTYYLANEDFELQEKIEGIASRERVNLSMVIVDALKEYVIKHGDGNPVFSLDPFIKDAEMAAVPAMFRSTEDWLKWILACDDEKFLQDIIAKNQTILQLADKRILELRGHTVQYVTV